MPLALPELWSELGILYKLCKIINNYYFLELINQFLKINSENILFNNKCLTTCPKTMYYDSSKTCLPCIEGCLECINGTSCKIYISDFQCKKGDYFSI
jgi:hypothetical protein